LTAAVGLVVLVILFSLLIVVTGSASAHAAGRTSAVAVVSEVHDLPTIVANLRNWVMGILAALATLFLTIGGVRYLMAGGDPSEVERAKASFRSAAIGYALAVLAPVVLTVLKSIIGG
jgi:cytosine/uracil/thiamine/allantoin permease